MSAFLESDWTLTPIADRMGFRYTGPKLERLEREQPFCAATRHQFFFDGNKRTAGLMMTGELMASGFDAVNVPNARRLEFNVSLDHLFTTDDATPLLEFLVSCASE